MKYCIDGKTCGISQFAEYVQVLAQQIHRDERKFLTINDDSLNHFQDYSITMSLMSSTYTVK